MLYGMGEKALAAKLGVGLAEARTWVQTWQKAYPILASWRGKGAALIRKRRTLKTAGGRRIAFKGHPTPQVCFNYPVQSGAADVLYAALGILDQRLDGSGLSAIPLNVIHDEIVLEAPIEEAGRAAELLRDAMVSGFVQIFPGAETRGLVDVSVVDSWGEK